MIIKRIKFQCWKKLMDEAMRYAALGYKVEVKGWEDILGNVLTIMSEEEETESKGMTKGKAIDFFIQKYKYRQS